METDQSIAPSAFCGEQCNQKERKGGVPMEWLLFCGGSGSHGIVTELFKASAKEWSESRIIQSQHGTRTREFPSHLRCIIPISDNGGSSQDLIDYFGGPAVGDCRNMLLHAAGVVVDSVEQMAREMEKQKNAEKCDGEEEGRLANSSPSPSPSLQDVIRYVSGLVKALKVREPNRDGLKQSFGVLFREDGSGDDGAEGGGGGEGATAGGGTSTPPSSSSMSFATKSRRIIEGAVTCYADWEEGLRYEEMGQEGGGDALGEVAAGLPAPTPLPLPAADAVDCEFSLPPSLTAEGGSLATAPATIPALLEREPVNYVGASTGNVLLFALFLQSLGGSNKEEREEKSQKGESAAVVAPPSISHPAALGGALEEACAILWRDVLCIPYLVDCFVSHWPQPRNNNARDGGDCSDTAMPSSSSSAYNSLPFPTLSVLPSIDYYRNAGGGVKEKGALGGKGDTACSTGGAPAVGGDVADADAGGSGGAALCISTVDDDAAAIRIFRAQEVPVLCETVAVPSTTAAAAEERDDGASTTNSKSTNDKAEGANSLLLLLRPLPFARLDTLLEGGKVVEGQKEFSYGMGPTPHGTPLGSRSPSVGAASYSASARPNTGGTGGFPSTPRANLLSNPSTTTGARSQQNYHQRTSSHAHGGGVAPSSIPLMMGISTPRTNNGANTLHKRTDSAASGGWCVGGIAGVGAHAADPATASSAGLSGTPRLSRSLFEASGSGSLLHGGGGPATATTEAVAAAGSSAVVDNASFSSSTSSKNAISKSQHGGASSGLSAVPLCVDYSIQNFPAAVSSGGVCGAAPPVDGSSSPPSSSSSPSSLHRCIGIGIGRRREFRDISVEPSRGLKALLAKALPTSSSSSQSSPNGEDSPSGGPSSLYHIIFSRGSFFTSLGASCVPVAEELAAIVRGDCALPAAAAAEEEEVMRGGEVERVRVSSSSSAPPNTTHPPTRISFILNGSVDRETQMFFGQQQQQHAQHTHQSLPHDSGGALLSPCPVANALNAFYHAILHMKCHEEEEGHGDDVGGERGATAGEPEHTMPRRLRVFGVANSKWHEGFLHASSSSSSSSRRPAVEWLTPKASAFSASSMMGPGGPNASAAAAHLPSSCASPSAANATANRFTATMYDDGMLVANLLK